MKKLRVHSKIRPKYPGLFGFENTMDTHQAALMVRVVAFLRALSDLPCSE